MQLRPSLALPEGFVAWSPDLSHRGVQLGAIILLRDQKLSHDLYFSYLSDRIQRMVNIDRDALAVELEAALEDGGLWEKQANFEPDEAANVMIYSNPVVWQRVRECMDIGNMDPPHVHNPEALMHLQEDLMDPVVRLGSWVSAIAFPDEHLL